LLEQLRIEMITAFHIYSEKFGMYRANDWDNYCRARENFLRVSALEKGLPYRALKDLLDPGEGN
jgi:hypothetical protein